MQEPGGLAVTRCFPGCGNRKLEPKCSRQDLNRHPEGMQVLHGGLAQCSTLLAREDIWKGHTRVTCSMVNELCLASKLTNRGGVCDWFQQ